MAASGQPPPSERRDDDDDSPPGSSGEVFFRPLSRKCDTPHHPSFPGHLAPLEQDSASASFSAWRLRVAPSRFGSGATSVGRDALFLYERCASTPAPPGVRPCCRGPSAARGTRPVRARVTHHGLAVAMEGGVSAAANSDAHWRTAKSLSHRTARVRCGGESGGHDRRSAQGLRPAHRRRCCKMG